MRLGLLSTARINDAILAGASESDRVEVVAVGSRSAERAQAYAAEHGIPRSHGSYEALLEDPDIDAVYISLPNSLHHEWAIRSLAAGKHVLCEKPYSRSPAEVEEVSTLPTPRASCSWRRACTATIRRPTRSRRMCAKGRSAGCSRCGRHSRERSCGLSLLNARLSLLQVHHGGCIRPAPSTERHKNACGSRPVTSR